MSKALDMATCIFETLIQYTKNQLVTLVSAGAKIAARDVLAEFLIWCYLNIPGDVVQSATEVAKKRLQEMGLRQAEPPDKKPENSP